MTITTRAGKGSELTHAELDTNFTDLRDGVSVLVPKTQGTGIKVDSLGTPDFGWHDLVGNLHVDEDDTNAPKLSMYRGVRVKARKFLPTTTEALISFHVPHDYVMGTEIYIHVHWSHNSPLVTGGSATWGFELMYSKGHDQGAFGVPVTIAIVSPANTTQYQHMINETVASSVGGSATTLDTSLLEVDGVIQGAIYLDSNDITSSGAVPDPFVHFVDIHYQSTGVATKQRSPDFWT